MNIFKKNKIKILANISVGFVFLLMITSLIPSFSFAKTKGSVTETLINVPGFNLEQTTSEGTGYTNTVGVSSYNAGRPSTFYDLIVNTIVGGMLNPIVVILVSLAVVYFLWGVFKFIKAEGKEKDAGKDMMIWGIVGIFVMVSMWGLVNILINTFDLDTSKIDVKDLL